MQHCLITLSDLNLSNAQLKEEKKLLLHKLDNLSSSFVYISKMLNCDDKCTEEAWSKENFDMIHNQIILLRENQNRRNDVNFELESLQVRLETKSQQVMDLTDEINKLQIELENKSKELDRLKFSELKVAAANKLQELDKDNDMELLRSQIEDLTEQVNLFASNERQMNIELENKKEEILFLKSLMQKLEEKDDTTEKLLERLRARNISQVEEIEVLRHQLITVQEETSSLRTNIRELEFQLSESYGQLKFLDSSSANELHVTDLQSQVRFLKEEVDSVRNEKQELENYLLQARNKLLDLDIQLTEKLNSPSSNFVNVQAILSELSYKLPKLFDSTEIISRLEVMEDKMKSTQNRIDLLRRKSNLVILETDKKQSELLIQAHKNLETAQQKYELIAAESLQLKNNLAKKESELDMLKNSVNSLQSNMLDREEFFSMQSRALNAEKRLAAVASDQAKKFAQSARVVAFLESECFRLHGLCDHFKSVNYKQAAPSRKGLMRCRNCNSLEIRIVSLVEQNSDMSQKLCSLEEENIKIQNDHDRLVNELRRQMSLKSEQLNNELEHYKQTATSSENQIVILKQENKKLSDKLIDIEKKQWEENQTIKNSLIESEQQRMEKIRLLSERESEISDLMTKLKEAKLMCVQTEERYLLLTHEIEAKSAASESTLKELKSDMAEKNRQIKILDQKILELRNDLSEKDLCVLSRDRDIADLALKYSNNLQDRTSILEKLDSKNRELEEYVKKNQTAVEDLSNLKYQVEQLSATVEELQYLYKGSLQEAEYKDQQLRFVNINIFQ